MLQISWPVHTLAQTLTIEENDLWTAVRQLVQGMSRRSHLSWHFMMK
jgi:hypothetical protein